MLFVPFERLEFEVGLAEDGLDLRLADDGEASAKLVAGDGPGEPACAFVYPGVDGIGQGLSIGCADLGIAQEDAGGGGGFKVFAYDKGEAEVAHSAGIDGSGGKEGGGDDNAKREDAEQPPVGRCALGDDLPGRTEAIQGMLPARSLQTGEAVGHSGVGALLGANDC